MNPLWPFLLLPNPPTLVRLWWPFTSGKPMLPQAFRFRDLRSPGWRSRFNWWRWRWWWRRWWRRWCTAGIRFGIYIYIYIWFVGMEGRGVERGKKKEWLAYFPLNFRTIPSGPNLNTRLAYLVMINTYAKQRIGQSVRQIVNNKDSIKHTRTSPPPYAHSTNTLRTPLWKIVLPVKSPPHMVHSSTSIIPANRNRILWMGFQDQKISLPRSFGSST